MKILLSLTLVYLAGIAAQENAARNIPASLLECYNTTAMLVKDDRLPHSMPALIALIRKIENTAGLNMDLRTLSIALLHRFRQDGIERNPSVQVQDGIVPFSPTGMSFSRHAATLKLIPGNAISFPNSSLTAVERCSLHYMLSSSFEMIQRDGESSVCSTISQTAQYRVERNVGEEDATESESIGDDVETLTPQELEMIKHKTNEYQPKVTTEDPNWLYPALPPNHPDSARISTYTQSSCPVENGVVKTKWGAVSMGPVLAGIAAALEPQTVTLAELLSADLEEKGYTSGPALTNRWIATLGGDLAEAALIQGPGQVSSINIGAIGGFNSTALPRWYFLTTNENLETTTAEIRGDLDGLILADSVASWYSSVSTLRLSQILDMYYSSRGVFNSTMRACNRRTLFSTVAENATMVNQVYSSALLLYEEVARVTMSAERIQSLATIAANALSVYIPASMNSDLPCDATNAVNDSNTASADLTIIIDTTWPFTTIQPFLASLLEGIEVGKFNSNFTLINGYDGSLMINSSNTLLDFYSFNATQYANFTSGFDLPKALEALRILQKERLNKEQSQNIGGSNSDVVLVLSYTSSITTDTDKEYCLQQLRIIREEVPDSVFLYLTYGSKDKWSDIAANSTTDTFAITATSTTDTLTTINPVISRIKQIPKRLINSACGASFSSTGSTASFVDYVEPSGIKYYRLNPNYFSTDTATVKVQGAGWGYLNVCTSRSVVQPNSTSPNDVSCTSVTTNTHSISISCSGVDLIHRCQPLYLSVAANASDSVSYQCTDANVCRYPDMRKFTISYDNLVCRSSASTFFFAPLVLVVSFIINFM
ncbi:uncharacterized protein [Neodiprion pinetum]|uniref:uncharacterized protein n=1 Tax=Neodiprion pinetum TaxID=441929 RepID=UPI001EDD19C9|nr:uncharacterized protein LOC124218823 [Neodiprion pinetum]